MLATSLLMGIVSGLTSMVVALASGMGVLTSLLIYPASGLAGMLLTILLILAARQLPQLAPAPLSRTLP